MILQANLQAWRRATTGLCRSHNYPRRPVLLVRANQQYFPFTSTRQRLQQLEANGAKLDIPATSKLEKEQTAMLYLDNIFPLRINVFDIRQWFFRDTEKCLETRARGALLDKGEIGHDFTIKHLEARIKDGGAVVTFGFRSTDENKRQVAKEIVSKISDNLRRKRVVASFNFQPIRAFFVKGEPFFEDILNRYPSLRLRVEFQGEPVSIEKLYKHFRPYGRIYDISVYPNPLVSKDPARYAIVQFTRIRSATSARNCLHGHTIHGCRMNILYERQLSERTNWIKDWIVGHPRISVPIIAALVAGLTYAVFDPIRVFFIVSNVTQRFNLESYGIYQWFRRETWARIVPSSNRSTVNHQDFWQDDHEDIEKVKSWMNETPETFVLISGPKGSGKSALVKAAIQDRRNTLFIDCEELANTRNQSDMITTLAKQVGYFPIFTWISSISNVLETAVVASTGQKGGFTSSPETQIRKILEAVAVAVGQVNSKEKAREARSQGKSQSFIDSIKHWFDLHLQNPKEKKHSGTGNEKDAMRADIPVIIIDNFMYRETPQNQMLWNELADFAALLVENEVAHVVFISSNVGVQKVLSRALPGKSFETIALSDAPPEVAMSLISRQLGKEYVDEDLHQIVIDLGGHLTELELLIQKLKMNMDPQAAFEDIVQRNVVEIRKYGFKEAVETDEKYNPQWTAIQFWEIVKGLASSKSLNFDKLKWGPFFKGDEKPLREMERAELITILQKDGRPNSIRPGKPVFYTVFDRLVSDSVFSASMEIETNNYLKKIADDTITKLEDTVGSLSRIYNGKPPKEIERRIKYLLKKIASNQEAIEAYEQRIQEAKRVVASSWEDCGS